VALFTNCSETDPPASVLDIPFAIPLTQKCCMRRAAIQQAVSAKMQYNGTGGSLGTEADMRIWGHMYNAFEGLAASSAWPRQHEFSQVTNNEASVFHERTLICAKMFSPHDRLPITWKTPHRDRAPLNVSCRFPWEDYDQGTRMLRTRHDMYFVVAMCIALPPSIEPSLPTRFEHGERYCTSKAAEDPTSARFVKSSIR
jgi:hypothetical protein